MGITLEKFVSNTDSLIFRLEIRHLCSHTRRWHFVLLLLFGVFFVPAIYPDASPFVPIIFVVFSGLELQYDNLLFRTGNELEAYLLLPVSWERVVIAKNLAAVVLTIIIFLITSMSLLYFSPTTIILTDLKDALLYLSTIIFPLIHFGNTQSVRNPRRISGLQINDLVEAIWMLLNVLILSAPYYLIIKLIEMPILCLVYSVITILIWRHRSVGKTAEYIKKNQYKLCQTK
jgi:hypothetical protein